MTPPDPRPDPTRASWTDLAGEARGTTYDGRWEELAARGEAVHGEADLCAALLGPDRRATVLDGGCGTGRVAIELARRGHRTVGLDRDHDLLARARAKAPGLRWVEADLLATGDHLAPGTVDLAVLAGNVLVFVDPGTEGDVLGAVATALAPGGLLVAGFQVRRRGYGPAGLDRDAAAAGLALRDRWATWDRDPWVDGGDYQVSVHVRT